MHTIAPHSRNGCYVSLYMADMLHTRDRGLERVFALIKNVYR